MKQHESNLSVNAHGSLVIVPMCVCVCACVLHRLSNKLNVNANIILCDDPDASRLVIQNDSYNYRCTTMPVNISQGLLKTT